MSDLATSRNAWVLGLMSMAFVALGAPAQAQDNPNQAVIDQAAATKAVADAKKAAADAQAAQYAAQSAAAKAQFGDIPSSGTTGTATAAAGAGGAEANLLGAKAMKSAAVVIARQVCNALATRAARCPTTAAADANGGANQNQKPPLPEILMFGSTNVPDFQALAAFNIQVAYILKAGEEAARSAPPALATTAAPTAPGVKSESVATFGVGLDAVNKLLSFFKTDYSFASVDVTGTDAMLMNAVAEALPANTVHMQVPTLYVSDIVAADNGAFNQTVAILNLAATARQNQKRFEGGSKDADKAGAAIWKNLGDTIDAWTRQMSTADDKGNVQLATVIRESAMKQKLDGGAALLIVQAHKAGGTTYTKKNLFSSLGANPFFVMGGVVAGYTLLDGKNGDVLASSLIPLHGGYVSVSDVQAAVNPVTDLKGQP